ncbi:MAG: rod shape-determining protein MreC [Chloroflexi bacterium]|nr:rod shape-determining protein MreC [Chloroflexota bacterium]
MSGIYVSAPRPNRAGRRRAISYAVTVGLLVALVVASSSAPVKELQRGLAFALTPFAEGVNGLGREARSLFDAVAEIDRLRLQNADLRTDLQRLEARNRALEALAAENEELAAILQLRGALEYQAVAARVLARETADVSRSIMIDVGTDDGVVDGDVVVASGGALAGRVVETGSAYARVVLINDPASSVVGEIASSRATGEVIGDLGGTLVMDKIDATEKVAVGDEVITAGIVLGQGIRSPFPRGLVIGRVIDSTRDPNAVVQTAYLEPAVDLGKLEFVLVITDYEGGIPGPGQIPASETNPDGTLPDTEQPFATVAPSARPTRAP